MNPRDDDEAQVRYLRAYERHQRQLEARERFETTVMFVLVLAFVVMAWWVS